MGEAARASVAGLSEDERASLARSYIGQNARSYPLVDPLKISVAAQSSSSDPTTFEVVLRYDASQQFMFRLANLLPMPAPLLERRAAIKRGGY